jgi:hypothetical protein
MVKKFMSKADILNREDYQSLNDDLETPMEALRKMIEPNVGNPPIRREPLKPTRQQTREKRKKKPKRTKWKDENKVMNRIPIQKDVQRDADKIPELTKYVTKRNTPWDEPRFRKITKSKPPTTNKDNYLRETNNCQNYLDKLNDQIIKILLTHGINFQRDLFKTKRYNTTKQKWVEDDIDKSHLIYEFFGNEYYHKTLVNQSNNEFRLSKEKYKSKFDFDQFSKELTKLSFKTAKLRNLEARTV